jgi:hypothetical protein
MRPEGVNLSFTWLHLPVARLPPPAPCLDHIPCQLRFLAHPGQGDVKVSCHPHSGGLMKGPRGTLSDTTPSALGWTLDN